MEISVTQQMQIFFGALAIGCVFGMIFDIFRAVRALIPPPTVIAFVQDILFTSLCACLCFTYTLLTNSGQLRAYIFVGAAIGFIIYFNTVGAIFIKAFRRMTLAIKRALSKAFRAISQKIGAFFALLWKKTSGIRKKLKKFLFFFKKPFIFLQKCCRILNGRLSRGGKRRKSAKTASKPPIKSSGKIF